MHCTGITWNTIQCIAMRARERVCVVFLVTCRWIVRPVTDEAYQSWRHAVVLAM